MLTQNFHAIGLEEYKNKGIPSILLIKIKLRFIGYMWLIITLPIPSHNSFFLMTYSLLRQVKINEYEKLH